MQNKTFYSLLGLILVNLIGVTRPAIATQESGLDLPQLLQQSMDNSPVIAAQYWQQQRAQQRVQETQGALQPELRFSTDLSAAWTRHDNFVRTANQLLLSFPLYNPALQSSNRVSKLALESEQFLLTAQQQKTLLTVAKAYYQFWQRHTEQVFLQKERTFLQDLLQQSQQRIKVGRQDLTDLSDIEARLDKNQAAQWRAQEQAQQVLNELSEVVGRDLAKTHLKVPKPVALKASQWPVLEQQLTKILANAEPLPLGEHPLLQAWEKKQAVQGESAVQQRKADGVKIEAYGALVYNDSDQVFYDDMRSSRGGVRLTMPLYLGGQTKARVAQAKHQQQALQAQFQQQRLRLRKSALNAWSAIQKGQQRLQALKQAENSNQRALAATEKAIITGSRDVLDLLNAQRNLYATQRDMAALQYAMDYQRIALAWAFGKLNIDFFK